MVCFETGIDRKVAKIRKKNEPVVVREDSLTIQGKKKGPYGALHVFMLNGILEAKASHATHFLLKFLHGHLGISGGLCSQF